MPRHALARSKRAWWRPLPQRNLAPPGAIPDVTSPSSGHHRCLPRSDLPLFTRALRWSKLHSAGAPQLAGTPCFQRRSFTVGPSPHEIHVNSRQKVHLQLIRFFQDFESTFTECGGCVS